MADMVKHPKHYTQGSIEVWDFITDQGMDYLTGNAVKYLSRYRHKGNPLQDLEKAQAYVAKLIEIERTKELAPFVMSDYDRS
jgi:hypothetical protein